jgi:hypothetical protein
VLIYGEDYELCNKIYKSGNCITALTDAVVYHIHREDAKGLFRQSFGFGRSHAYCLRYLVKGAFIMSVPFFKIAFIVPYCRIWVDVIQLDKKVALLFLFCILFPPLFLPALFYLGYISRKNYQRGRARGLTITWTDAIYMTYLLLVKSLCLGAGRLAGSLKYRVICI